ncbi:hypothetical protein HNQ35_000044 [Cerasibacillus quisquiliarum]|nr:hypothetical protein [Cerasibacillus quisquiliarum]
MPINWGDFMAIAMVIVFIILVFLGLTTEEW